MRKGIVAAAAGLSCALALAADTQAPIPREGKIDGTKVMSGPLQVLPLGPDHARISFDVMGVELDPGGILHNASVRCVGAIMVTKDNIDEESSVCVYTRLDGDQVFASARTTGKVGPGAESKGTWKFIGGTGKMAGIQGSGEHTRYVVRRAAEGTSQSVVKSTGTYKLPTTTAER